MLRLAVTFMLNMYDMPFIRISKTNTAQSSTSNADIPVAPSLPFEAAAGGPLPSVANRPTYRTTTTEIMMRTVGFATKSFKYP